MAKKARLQIKKPLSSRMMNKVRIIGGKWKRTSLPVLQAPGLRPTPDRVRETLFNWITHLCHGYWDEISCLDLFAGTGALGFESASRGARHVTMVESDKQVFHQLQAIIGKLRADNIDLVCQDALEILQQLVWHDKKFNLIFVDPPYEKDVWPEILNLCKNIVMGSGWVYLEFNQPIGGFLKAKIPGWQAEWEIVREDQAGYVYYYLLQLK